MKSVHQAGLKKNKDKEMKQISILGCGWLGLPLAEALIADGFSVKGSTTSENKMPLLEKVGIEPFLIALSENTPLGSISDFLENSSILIIDIPPKLRGTEKENFVSKIAYLIPFIKKSTIQNVLFVSSTSVYGNADDIITEETPPKPDTESGKQLLEAEMLLQKNDSFKTTVLRFGGLIGDDRNPVKFLSGKQNIENPDAPINFIHQEDCIGIILQIIARNSWNQLYNGVSPFHPTRELYYTQKATELNLPLPKFDHSKTAVKRLISGDKAANELGYFFIKTNL